MAVRQWGRISTFWLFQNPGSTVKLCKTFWQLQFSCSSPNRDPTFVHTLVYFPKLWEQDVCYIYFLILPRLGNWLHKIKWLGLGHTVTKWQGQDLTQIAWLQSLHSLQGCCAQLVSYRDQGSLPCMSSCLFNCSRTSSHISEHFPQCLAQVWAYSRCLIIFVTWKLNLPFDT